jgi:hypothetical protein
VAALAVALLCLARPVAAAGAQPSGKPYDIMVVVMARGGVAQVVVSYPQVVDHAALQAGIAQLGARAGVKPSQVVIRDAPLARRVATPATDAEFLAAGLVSKTGRLPVGAIIRALPMWEHMRLVFLLEEGYRFAGPGDATADGFAVRLVSPEAAAQAGGLPVRRTGGMTTCEYDVERTIGKASAAGEVAAVAEPGAEGAGEQASSPRPSLAWNLLPALLIGMPAGLLAGWLLYGWRERGGRTRRLRGSRPQANRPS